MIATAPTNCRVVVADRGFHRYGLASVVKDAGYRVREPYQQKELLQELGLLEMDVLLEVDAGRFGVSDFFPAAFRLKAWRPLVCANGLGNRQLGDQPTLVLARKEGLDPSTAFAAYQEVVTMLLAAGHPRSTAVADTAFADTLCDVASPLTVTPPPIPRLAREVAHDLNNFLTIVRGHCELLLSQPPTASAAAAEQAQALVRDIAKAGEQATLLTSQLAAASHSQDMPCQAQDLNVLVREAAGMVRSLLAPGQELVLRLDTQPCPIRVVPGQLERVLVNLAANAKQAMPDGGTLSITSARMSFQPALHLPAASIAGPHVLLTVADTGVGIDERCRARLFQPKSSSRPGGKGLGLPIVGSIVHQHQGQIEVVSEPGQGSAFRLYFPLIPASALPKGDTDGAAADNAGADTAETVMLVEDESMVRSIFRRILQENGYFVLEAANGPEALCLAEQFAYPIHLLITDLAMPKMTGIELIDRLVPLHPETKVLLLSGYSEGVFPGQAAPVQPLAFLQKPFKAETLLQKARAVIQGLA